MAPDADTAAIRTFADYRKFFDEMGKELDAVSIATPNHQHALPALLAMRRGIHVYVEKPLTHTLAEARQLAEEARRCKVATQMGNQGQSSEGARLLCEYIQAGAIGQVREVLCWSDHANGFPQDINVRPLFRCRTDSTGISGSAPRLSATTTPRCIRTRGTRGPISGTARSATWAVIS
jgi:predicted dehydrogenase